MDIAQTIKKHKLLVVFDYLVVFIITIYAGKATVFVQAIEGWDHPVGLFFPIVVFTAFGFIKNIRFNRKFLLLIIGYTLYFIASTLKFGQLHPRFFLINIIHFTFAYLTISGLRYRFFSIYETILFYLCIIAIVFWILMNVFPESFIEFLRHFEFSSQGEPEGNIDYNTIVYTVSNFNYKQEQTVSLGALNLFRNSGFAWEPGAFAVYINIAIFFNLIRNKFNLRNNGKLWIFIAALATTFSTTGYSIFVLLVLFYIYNQRLVRIIWLIPVILLMVFYLFTLPFMAEKITKTFEFNTRELVYNSLKYDAKYQPQRFESLRIDFVDFLNHPLIGYGGHQDAKWTNQMGATISTVSGIGKIMAQYGIVGILFFSISLWKSSKQLIKVFNVRGLIFPILFILLISISYGLFIALYMCLWLFYLSNFKKSEVVKRYYSLNLRKS